MNRDTCNAIDSEFLTSLNFAIVDMRTETFSSAESKYKSTSLPQLYCPLMSEEEMAVFHHF